MKTVKALIVVVSFIMLAACGGGGGPASSPNPLDPGNVLIPAIPSAADSEGSVSSPIVVAIDSPRPNSKVAAATGLTAPSYYTFTTGLAGTYVVGLTNTRQYVSWDLYSDPFFSTQITDCDNNFLSGDEVGLVALQAGTTYYLKVSNFVGFSADSYTLAVSRLQSEGTTVTPVDLTVAVSHSGSIAANGKSYYRFKTTKTGAFTLSYTNVKNEFTGSIGIKVYQNADFTGLLASSSPQYIMDCTANGLQPDTYYYVEVSQGANSGILYDLKVSEGISEGSITSPVVLPVGTARNGGVDGSGSSYYSFTTTTAGAYILTAAPASTVEVSVYSSSDFSTALVKNYTVSSSQAATISGLDAAKQYYIKIARQTSPDTTYSITVSSGVTEGSVVNPVPLAVGLSRTATVDSYGTAYYYFKTNTSGTYTVNLSSSQSMNWDLYSDSGYSKAMYILGTYASSCITSGTSGGNCTTANLDAGVNYYLKVTSSSSSSAPYAVVVNGAVGSEGSILTPIVLTEGTSHAGTIAGAVSYSSSYSYYTFTAGSSRPYMIKVTDVLSGGQNDIQWDMYTTPGFSGAPAAGVYNIPGMKTFAGDAVAVTSGTLTAGTNYYIRVSNGNTSKNTYSIEVLPYDSVAGCNAGGTCINFESGLPASPAFNLYPQTPIQNTATSAWGIDATQSATGTASFKAGNTAPQGANKFPTYASCFQFQGTDIKWIDFSVATQAIGRDTFVFYLDGNSTSSNEWTGATAWKRLPVRVETNGLHTFEWCFFKNDTVSNTGTVWIDDISLHY